MISEQETLTGNVGDEYVATQKSIDGYTFVSHSGNTSGVFGEKVQTFTYTYKIKSIVKSDSLDKPELPKTGVASFNPFSFSLTYVSIGLLLIRLQSVKKSKLYKNKK